MKERGIDICLDAKPATVFYQCSRGAKIFFIAGWRNQHVGRVLAAKGIRSFADLKGKRIGVRDMQRITSVLFRVWLKRAGLDPDKDVTWVRGVQIGQTDKALEEGKVDCCTVRPPDDQRLMDRGYPVLLDPRTAYPGGRPDRATVATAKIVDAQPESIKAFLRGMIRAYWFLRDNSNYKWVRKLDEELRQESYDEEEKATGTLVGPGKLKKNPFPVDGLVPVKGLEAMLDEEKELGNVDPSFKLDQALRLDYVKEAFKGLKARQELREQMEKAIRTSQKYGY